MRVFKLTIEYDGSNFNGWQVQLNAPRTIQGEIETVLCKILKTPIRVIGAGRTDAGVHARGQVAHFRAVTDMPCDELMRAVNYNLPADIVIVAVEEAVETFHAQISAREKTYSYTVLNRSFPSALDRGRFYSFPRRLNVPLMREEAAALLGRHDFASFANIDPSRNGDTIRTISRIDILQQEKDRVIFFLTADGFLYKMVRNIVGTLLDIGSGRFSPGSAGRILLAADRRAAGKAAAPQGLCLESVVY